MEVDHVIPETLLNTPDRLKAVIKALGRPHDFDVNSYDNWMPACSSCNGRKLATVFEASPLIQLILQRAAERADKAKTLEVKTVSKREITKALSVLERAHEIGELDDELKTALQSLVTFQEDQRTPEMAGQTIRLTPLFEVLSEKDGWRIVRGPYGVGGRPVGPRVHNSFDCPNCGTVSAWNGVRCVICGEMNDE